MKKHYFIFLFLLSTFAISQVKIDSVFINKDSLKQLLGEGRGYTQLKTLLL